MKMKSVAGGAGWARAVRALCVGALALAGGQGMGGETRQAAAQANHRGGSLTVALSTDAATFDAALSVNTPDYGITTGALYSGLYRVDAHGALIPDIAAAMPTVSGGQTVFTVRLRKGVMFNGPSYTPREVTAQDLKYTMERVLNPKLKPGVSYAQPNDQVIAGADAYVAGKAKHVSGIAVLDRYTVRFTLDHPLASFPFVLGLTANWPVAREAVERWGVDFGSHPVGAGPFMLKEWVKGQRLVLVRNPLYFRAGQPYLDGLTFQFNVDKKLEVLRWKSGAVDAIGDAYDLPPAVVNDLSSDPTYGRYVGAPVASGQTNYININNLIKPFDSKLMRQAVAYAVNARRIVRLYRGQAALTHQLYPPATPQYQPGFTSYPYQPGRARALLKAAGYHGQPVEVLVDNQSSNDPIEAPSLLQDLKAVGINAHARSVSDALAGQLIFTNRGYTIAFNYWTMDYPDAYDFVTPSYTQAGFDGGLNFSRYRNPQIDALVSKAEALPFGAQRNAIYQRMQRILVDDVALIPLFNRVRFTLNGPRVGSLAWSPSYSLNDWRLAYTR